MAKTRTSSISRLGASVVLVALLSGTLGGCGSDKTDPTEALPSEAAVVVTEAPVADTTIAASSETAALETDAVIETAPAADTTDTGSQAVDSLAAESATCVAFAKVKELNDRSGALTSEFTDRMLAGAGSGDISKIERAWEEFRVKFAADSEIVLPDLQAAYATLAVEQPQYAEDFANLDDVTVKLLRMFASISYADLDKIEEKLAEAVPQDKTIAAGQSSLKIDKFSKAACGIAFANT